MVLPERVLFCEVGLRDGLQNEATLVSTEQKLEIARRIIASGIKVIELGSFVNPKAVPQMQDTDELFLALAGKTDVELRAFVANGKGVERAIACGCKKIKLNVSASRGHNLANLNRTPEESMAKFRECSDFARESGIEVSGSISMPFGSPWEGEIPLPDVQRIVEAYLDAGITEISLSDASGMATPVSVEKIACGLRSTFPEVTWWLHFHNTRGVGLANLFAALQLGFIRFDASCAGIGGCPFVPGAAGNIATEDALHLCEEMGVASGVDLDLALGTARLMAQMVKHPTDSYLLRSGTTKALRASKLD